MRVAWKEARSGVIRHEKTPNLHRVNTQKEPGGAGTHTGHTIPSRYRSGTAVAPGGVVANVQDV